MFAMMDVVSSLELYYAPKLLRLAGYFLLKTDSLAICLPYLLYDPNTICSRWTSEFRSYKTMQNKTPKNSLKLLQGPNNSEVHLSYTI